MALTADFTQTVRIQVTTTNDPEFFVRDLNVSWSTDQPISSADFIVEDFGQAGPVNQAYQSIDLGQEVTIEHDVGGTRKVFVGRIVSVNEQRGDGFSFKRVKCKSIEEATQSVRFLGQWDKTSATAIILNAWNEHAPNSFVLQDVSLAGVETNSTIIEEYTSEFDSLFDLMEQVAKLTDWSWRIEPESKVLEFFDPLTRTGPAITQDIAANPKIESGTLEADKSLSGVFNVYRGQAWRYRTRTFSHTFEDGDCVVGFPYDPDKIGDEEVVNIEIVEQVWRDAGIEVKELNEDEGLIRLNKSIIADEQAGTVGPFTVKVEHRGLVWVERIDEESILKYGRLDAPPISEDGGADIAAVQQNLDAMLRYRASPAVDLSLNLTGIGWNPNEIVTVTLDDPQLQAEMYVTGVSHTVNGNDMTVALSLTSPFEVVDGELGDLQSRRSRSRPDPVYEIGKRVERLERRSGHPAQSLGRNSDLFGIFAGRLTANDKFGWGETITAFVDPSNILDVWAWSEAVTAEIQTSVQDTHGWSVSTTVAESVSVQDAVGWAGSATAVVQEEVSAVDSQGWTGTVTSEVTAEEAVQDSIGWTGNIDASVTAVQQDSIGWTATTTAELQKAAADSYGWTQAVTTEVTAEETVQDAFGWSGGIADATITVTEQDSIGWSQSVTTELSGEIGLTVNDDVGFESTAKEITVNDDIGV